MYYKFVGRYQHILKTPVHEILHCVSAYDGIERVIYFDVSWEKHIVWVRVLKNLGLPTQLIIFLDFGAKILQIARPVNYSYSPPCHQ